MPIYEITAGLLIPEQDYGTTVGSGTVADSQVYPQGITAYRHIPAPPKGNISHTLGINHQVVFAVHSAGHYTAKIGQVGELNFHIFAIHGLHGRIVVWLDATVADMNVGGIISDEFLAPGGHAAGPFETVVANTHIIQATAVVAILFLTVFAGAGEQQKRKCKNEKCGFCAATFPPGDQIFSRFHLTIISAGSQNRIANVIGDLVIESDRSSCIID